jgi:hypothetical protein
MRGCSVCKIRYEDFVRVMEDGIARSYQRVFAIQVLAHTCERCGERYLGHGYHVDTVCYCCPECAYLSTAIQVA